MKNKLIGQAFLGLCILATLHSASSYKVTIINNSKFSYEVWPSMQIYSTFLNGIVSTGYDVAGNSEERETDISTASTTYPHADTPLLDMMKSGYSIELAVMTKSDCPDSAAYVRGKHISKLYEFTDFKQVIYTERNLNTKENKTAYTIEFPDIHIVIDENENVHMELITRKEVTPASALETKAEETAATTSEVLPPAAAAAAEGSS